MTVIFKPAIVIEELGDLGRLPDGGIVNIGGTEGPTFTVGGVPLLFANGLPTDGSGNGINLQTVYNNSLTGRIDLVAGKNFTVQALNGNIVSVDASSGKLFVQGDFEVLGDSSVIEGTIHNVDQLNIGTPLDGTVGLRIQPNSGVIPSVDLVQVRNVYNGPVVFAVTASGDVAVSGLVDGVDVSALGLAVTNHLDTNVSPAKHTAAQISAQGPWTSLSGDDVQEVLESIDTIISGGGFGTVTSVAVSSSDMAVIGSPITAAGTINLSLNTIPIAKGGTGEITAAAAINALVPPQPGNGGKVLGTDGVTVFWTTGGAATAAAGLFFTNAAPTTSGIVGTKIYVLGTVPANKVIAEATTDTNNVTVTLFAEGGAAFYSPTITITTVPPQPGAVAVSLVEDANDKRAYTATANLVNVSVDMIVNAVSSTGSTATMVLNRAAAAPVLSALTIGPYPGFQTEVKQGDILTVAGSVQNSATYAEIIAGGAAQALTTLTVGAVDSAGVGFRTLTGFFTVGTNSGVQSIQARGRTVLGTFGAPFTSTNTVVLNQTYPTIGARTIVYPPGQQGLKGVETATVSATITNFDTVLYTGTDISISSPATYGITKTVTRTGGTYVFGTNNYTISANRAANNATSIASSAITIADVVPTAAITIAGNPARLRSSPAGLDYVVTITASQRLLVPPTLVASSGTWQGSWVGSGTTWSRTLRILDSHPKGPQLFSSLSVTGLAGLVGSSITAGWYYEVGGFSQRIITYAAFSQWEAIGTSVVDINKVVSSYTGSSVLTLQLNTANVFQGFSITNSLGAFDAQGNYLFISDAAFAGANTTGTLQLTVEEVV